MSKKRFICFIFVVLSLVFVTSCSSDEKSTASSSNSQTIEEIVLKNITLDTIPTSIYLNETYNYNGVKVYAHYSDGSKVDVTESAVFSQVDTTTTGIKTVNVEFGGFTKTYTITVKSLTAVSLSLDTNGVKVNYKVGEVFSTENLSVSIIYVKNTVQPVDTYSISITNSQGISIDATAPFTNPGLYIVTVLNRGLTANYIINVYEETETYKSLLSDVSNYKMEDLLLEDNYQLLDDNYVNVISIGDTTMSSELYDSDDLIDVISEEECYINRLNMTATSSLKISLNTKTLIVFRASSSNASKIYFTDTNNTVYEPFGKLCDISSEFTISLKAGEYIFHTTDDLTLSSMLFFYSK